MPGQSRQKPLENEAVRPNAVRAERVPLGAVAQVGMGLVVPAVNVMLWGLVRAGQTTRDWSY